MTKLATQAGINIQWADDGTLTFGPDLIVDEVLSRPLSRLQPLALDPAACEPGDKIQYWMYNGIATQADHTRLAATGMRYELTLMFPDAIGRERPKTLGHLHSFPPGSALNYAEVCEVLHGTAHFVFQTMDIKTRQCHFCACVEAHPGDKVIIPPNLHHLTVNAGDEPLLFADVIPLAVTGIYNPLKDMHGAAYYYTLDGIWMPNHHYVSEAAMERPGIMEYPDLGLTSDKPLYTLFSESSDRLEWMLHPERFQATFPDLWEIVERADAAGKSV